MTQLLAQLWEAMALGKVLSDDGTGGHMYPTFEEMGFTHADLCAYAILLGVPVLVGVVVLLLACAGKNQRRGYRRK